MPHGHCYYWDPTIVWLHVVSDVLTAVSYYSIPVALVVFVRKRADLAFPGIFWLFGAFILACGTTHILNIVTLWHPIYRFEGVIKALTGGVSVVTAIVLWPLIPRALQLPSPTQLEQVNVDLRREIEQRENAEAALRAINEELERRVDDRTAELRRSNQDLERFAYVASHDLQEPLRVVSSYAKLLERRYADALEDDGREFIHTMVDASNRGRTLIEDLLEFSRIGRDDKPTQPVAIDEAWERTASRLAQELASVGGSLRFEDLEGFVVPGLPTRLEQVFENLLSNAIKYRSPDRPLEVHVSAREEGQWVELDVADNGIGIPDEQAKRAFEMFQRVHGGLDVEGTGVGLAICRRIVEHLGGMIWVVTGQHEGTRIRIWLPRESAS